MNQLQRQAAPTSETRMTGLQSRVIRGCWQRAWRALVWVSWGCRRCRYGAPDLCERSFVWPSKGPSLMIPLSCQQSIPPPATNTSRSG